MDSKIEWRRYVKIFDCRDDETGRSRYSLIPKPTVAGSIVNLVTRKGLRAYQHFPLPIPPVLLRFLTPLHLSLGPIAQCGKAAMNDSLIWHLQRLEGGKKEIDKR